MKWGVRKRRNEAARAAKYNNGSEDFKKKIDTHVKIKTTKGTHALSNKEMQEYVNRLNLEQQYSRLNPKTSPVATGHKFVKEGLQVFGTAAAVYAAVNSPLAKAILNASKKQ
jgi:hypothetical protein